MSDRFDHTLEHTLESKPDDGGDDAVTSVRRIELITGTGRRRRWSDDDKARIVIESLRAGANVSEVARRHGLSCSAGGERRVRAFLSRSMMPTRGRVSPLGQHGPARAAGRGCLPASARLPSECPRSRRSLSQRALRPRHPHLLPRRRPV